MGCDGDATAEQQHEQPHHCAGPHEAQFLADNGENEVVLRLGDEKMLLAAFPQTEAGGPAGADGIEALDGLVAVAQRVGEGVEPGAEPVGGVGDEVGHDGHRRTDRPDASRARQQKPPQPRTTHEHQHRADAEDEDSAGQVRLQQHQGRHHPQHQRKGQNAHAEILHPVVVQRDDVGKHQHHRELCDLAGLQGAEPRDDQPPLAAVVLRHEEHRRQQYQRQPQQRPRQLVEDMVIHPAGQPHPAEPQRRVEQLRPQIGPGVAPPVERHGTGRAGQHHQPEAHQREHQDQKRQVHAGQRTQKLLHPLPPSL